MNTESCIFCAIGRHDIATQVIWEDKNYMVFCNHEPQMETHLLLIPKLHIQDFVTADVHGQRLIQGLLDIAHQITSQYHLKGCQLLINSGRDHGQEVLHLHLHLKSHTPIVV